MADHHSLSNFIWQIADLLRGPYRPPQYERVMLPMTVLRRFDCILAPTKADVLAEYNKRKERLSDEALDSALNRAARQRFHNRSQLDFQRLKADPDNINQHLTAYINGFSKNVQDIFNKFEFTTEIERMHEANILYLVVSKFCDLDLHPDVVDNIHMGSLFEDLIRRFNEAANETAGDHFTPREVIRLMVDVLFAPDDEQILATPDKVYKLLDPTCGTGGMLSEAKNHLRRMNLDERLFVFGQDFNPRSYAIAASDLLLKGYEDSDVRFGDSLIDDKFGPIDDKTKGQFDYFLANPPFGVDWKRQQKIIVMEHQQQAKDGRFGAGLPRVNDGSLLFLQHMMSKFTPYVPGDSQCTGSRLAIVFNGSPLFTGGAGSGESEIRKDIIQKDWLEAIIALPEQMFYNTGIGTYIWIVTNRKQPHRRGKIQLIDARSDQFYVAMRRSLGDKRRRIAGAESGDPDQIGEIVRLYGNFDETEYSKIFYNEDFGYNRVPIERPLRLLYQMNSDRKARFLDAVPHLLDDVQIIDRDLGRTERDDWSLFDRLMTESLMRRGRRWKANERKLFRDVFTERHPEAQCVILGEPHRDNGDPEARLWGWFPARKPGWIQRYEPDTKLRDFEHVRLLHMEQSQSSNDDVHSIEEVKRHVHEQVILHISDAWADRTGIRSAYEINFNRHFYKYTHPRPLVEIDADLKQIEEEIIRLLREVTT